MLYSDAFNRSITGITRADEKTRDAVNILSALSAVPSSYITEPRRRSPNGIKTEGGVSRLNEDKHQFALTLARRVVVEIGNRELFVWLETYIIPFARFHSPFLPSVSSSTRRSTSIALFFNDEFFNINLGSKLFSNKNIQAKTNCEL